MAAADVPAIAKLFNNAELLDHSGRKSAARDLAAATAVGICKCYVAVCYGAEAVRNTLLAC